jgi:hypothetical protein
MRELTNTELDEVCGGRTRIRIHIDDSVVLNNVRQSTRVNVSRGGEIEDSTVGNNTISIST